MENVALRIITEDLLLQQEPVAETLSRKQSDDATFAEAVKIWLDLLARFPASFKKQHQLVVERSKDCLEDGVFLAANLLHHKFGGSRLNETQRCATRTQVETACGDPTSLTRILSRDPPFRNGVLISTFVPPLGGGLVCDRVTRRGL